MFTDLTSQHRGPPTSAFSVPHVLEVLLTPAGETAREKADAEVVGLEEVVRSVLDATEQGALIDQLARVERAAQQAERPPSGT